MDGYRPRDGRYQNSAKFDKRTKFDSLKDRIPHQISITGILPESMSDEEIESVYNTPLGECIEIQGCVFHRIIVDLDA